MELIRDLDGDELHQVGDAVRQQLDTPPEAATLDALHRALLEAGLVLQIKTPPLMDRERPLVPIQGAPLSQTIIEERR